MIGENEFTGKHIGTYKLVAEFHSGQLSSAYRAEQAGQTPQPVVLHLFHAVRLPTAKQEQFLREVRTLKKVKHPYVLPVLESGFFDDMPYIVTEYAAHGSLRDRLNQGPPPTIPEAVTIITRIGQALQFNHQVNIIHGNLKPENILFDEQGEARLADCRVMAIVDSVPIELAHNTNTYPYMAPEQFYGKTSKESDQYALGCIAYELLTGIAPFAEADFRTMGNKHRQEVLVPPTQLNMLLPSHMQAAILTAMSKQETARYLHIKDFIAALTTSARPASPAPIAIVSPALVMPIAANIPTFSPEISLPQPDEAQAIYTNMVEQPEKPPDTPAMNTDVEPLMPVENTPVPELPTFSDTIDADAPPVTPQPLSETPETQEVQQEQDGQTVQDISSADAHEDAGQPGQHKNFAGDDELPTLPVPAVNAVSPVNPAIPANNAFQENSLPTHADNSSVVVPTHAIQQTGFAGTNIVHDEAGHERRKLAKNFALLVGISWCIIAVIILSMIFIILPSVHIPSGKSTTIVHDPTRQPTLHPSPTTHPKAAPTPHPTPSPTPRPTPSPTPIPSPSPTPSPTPSPSPTPVLGLIVSPTSINPNTDCQNVQFGYRCTITLAVPQEYQGNVKWTTASSNLNAFFSPPRGTLAPGQRQQVIIFVRNSCPHSGDLIFQTDSTRIVVSLNC